VTILELTVAEPEAGERLDRFLASRLPERSRSFVQRLITEGYVSVDGRRPRPADRLRPGQHIRVDLPPPAPTGLVPVAMPLSVVYESPDLLVINKPAGLVVHPAPGHATDTLVNALLARYPGLTVGNALRPGIVHRLDRGTSGLMVVALTDRAFHGLVAQMKQRTVHKEYLALVHGRVTPAHGVIEAPIGRDPQNRLRMAVVAHGRHARTGFRVVEYFDGFSLLRLTLDTGRTHQIRVHLSSIGHPVVGDTVYGPRQAAFGLDRPFLHAWYLGFQVPGQEFCLALRAPLPPELEAVLAVLRSRRGAP